MKPLSFSAFALLAFCTGAARADARATCAPRDAVIAQLAERYDESRHAVGLGDNNMLVEVFVSPTSGSWTITVTSATGLTCLIATGHNFETLAETLPADGSDA